MNAVVIGGGTGAPVSIKALLRLGVNTSAVVAMADDGGSSGLLRESTGTVPPGDIRKCLVAMAADPASPLARAFGFRFDYLYNHTLGNLLLMALANTTGTFAEAISVCEGLLEARGRVYPSTLESVVLSGKTRDNRYLSGQKNICASETAMEAVYLSPSDPEAYEPALAAIREADLVVLGPGSLFTSIIPNLLVPGVTDAIHASRARSVFLCSLADMQGETWGLNAAEHVEALLDHGMRDLLDVVVVHRKETSVRRGSATVSFAALDTDTPAKASRLSSAASIGSIRPVSYNEELAARIEKQGPMLLVRDLVDPIRPTWHDIEELSELLKGVLLACHSRQKSKTNSLG